MGFLADLVFGLREAGSTFESDFSSDLRVIMQNLIEYGWLFVGSISATCMSISSGLTSLEWTLPV